MFSASKAFIMAGRKPGRLLLFVNVQQYNHYYIIAVNILREIRIEVLKCNSDLSSFIGGRKSRMEMCYAIGIGWTTECIFTYNSVAR